MEASQRPAGSQPAGLGCSVSEEVGVLRVSPPAWAGFGCLRVVARGFGFLGFRLDFGFDFGFRLDLDFGFHLLGFCLDLV